jgi:arsenate reductase (thioredoxin)
VQPEVVEAMHEIGIEIGSVKPQRLTEELARTASVLITMGCGEKCIHVPGLRTADWALLDPKGQSLESIRAIRDEIHERVS